MNEKTIRELVAQVVASYEQEDSLAPGGPADPAPAALSPAAADLIVSGAAAAGPVVPVEASARHVHLSKADVAKLFGDGYQLTKKKDISQPGQYLCEERVSLIGPKGRIDRVGVLGPPRADTQVEISLTDSRALGIEAPVRMSGDLAGSADIHIMAGNRILEAKEAVIAARNHLHMTGEDARRYGLQNGQKIGIKVGAARPVVFEDVVVRVGDNAKLAFHIDYDEANACGFTNGDKGVITGSNGGAGCVCAARQDPQSRMAVKPSEKPAEKQEQEPCRHIEERLLTERILYACYRDGIRSITIAAEGIITPMAKDYAREKGIAIRYI